MTILRWGEWADAVIDFILQVKSAENFLIISDTGTDTAIGNACLVAGIKAKANAQLLVVPEMRAGRRQSLEFGSAAGAVLGSDVILGLCEINNDSIQNAMYSSREKGARISICDVKNNEAWVIEGVLDVDLALMTDVAQKICALWSVTELCRVTSNVGTDISFQLKGRPSMPGDGRAIKQGTLDFFPGATPSVAPVENTINGTIVVDGSVDAGPVSTPITLEVVSGYVTEIKGEADADLFRKRLESTGDPKAFAICHWNLGINPRAKMGHKMAEDEMVMGAITFGFGNQDPDFEGDVGTAKMHSDVVLSSGTITLDGTVMIEGREFNQDMGLGGL